MNSNAKFVFATTVAVILVAELTLPLAFDDHMLVQRKSYKKVAVKRVLKTEIEAVGVWQVQVLAIVMVKSMLHGFIYEQTIFFPAIEDQPVSSTSWMNSILWTKIKHKS